MTVDIGSDDDAIVLSVQLSRQAAARVLADAHHLDVLPCDVIAHAVDEHYARRDQDGSSTFRFDVRPNRRIPHPPAL
jgi:hypothetical protein